MIVGLHFQETQLMQSLLPQRTVMRSQLLRLRQRQIPIGVAVGSGEVGF